MIKAVIFDMFETLVSMFSGDTYFSEDMAAGFIDYSRFIRRIAGGFFQ